MKQANLIVNRGGQKAGNGKGKQSKAVKEESGEDED